MNGLVMERISHSFGPTRVLNDVSLVAEPGKLTCLLGASGSGKTTLLRLAAGLEEVQKGRITIAGQLVADGDAGFSLPPERRGAGLMFQDYALFPHLDVTDNVAFGIRDLTKARRQWIQDSLERLGLGAHRHNYPHELSGGQQQRVALLRAMAPEPGVLLLDEPFSGLDVTLRAQVREDTLGFLKESGVAVLMVTHDPEEAMFMADHIVIMKDGVAVQAGTPMQAYLHPVDAFVAELFGPVNRCTGTAHSGRVETVLGPFEALGFKDGQTVDILVRHEAIRVSQTEEAAPPGFHAAKGEVVSAHPLGRSSHLHIIVRGQDGKETLLHVRAPGSQLPEPGAYVTVWVEDRQAFIFAR